MLIYCIPRLESTKNGQSLSPERINLCIKDKRNFLELTALFSSRATATTCVLKL